MSDENESPSVEIVRGQLAAISECADEAIINMTLDGTVITWNPAAELLFGYSAREMIGKPVFPLIPPDRLDKETQILERTRRGESIQWYEANRVRKDGRIIPVAVTLSPVRDSREHILGVLKIARDISERKQLGRAEHDQLFLASIVSSAEDAIISKDLNGIITSWNKSAEKMFGYTAEEMIGKSIALLVPPDHSDEEPQILDRIRHGERIEHYETERVRKDGTIIEVALTVSPISDRMGRVVGASKIARDISERQRLEKAERDQLFLAAIVSSADDAIISKDLNGIVTSWNPAAQRLFGYSAEEMIGKPIMTLIPPDHSDEEPQILKRIRRGERIEHYETKRLRKDGRIIDVALSVSPIRDSLRRIIGASKIARDISEQKRSAASEREALKKAQEAMRQAEEASRAKDEFIATVSHELRTPLTAILGWTRMLLGGQLPPEGQQKALQTIDRNARAQAQLIEDLLDISRIVSGKLRVEFKAIDIAAVIAAAVEAVRPAAEARRVRILTVVSSDAGPILGDSDRLQQVVWNLLSNAIRFTRAEGFVQIELQRVESQVELRVSDNGIGIKPEFLPHIFDRFTQADSSITRSHGGLGMGLAIVKSLVELHGGVVSASSPGEGEGAVFTVKLPLRAVWPDPRQQGPVQKSLRDASYSREELVGLKILIVDDEQDTCELLRFVFDECGCIVKTANSAADALELFDSWQPDILVSDISMPEIDGYELIRVIRDERRSQIPAVALTAMARIDDRVKALTAGYQMHISKPVEPVELISIVTSLVPLVNRRPVP